MSLPPVECICVTEECIREWKNGNPSFKPPNPVPVLRFLYELCWTVVRGELPIQKCKAALDSVDFLDKVLDEEMGSNFADVVTQMAQDLTMPGEYRARLIKLAKWLVESALVPLRLFQERCEEEFLWESEMIKIKAADLKSKEVRVNTRLLYQQTKFNLLREESEGYAKLVTLLCQGSEVSNQNASAAIVGIIKSLIGHFDLDPNRVFDIVLECFELQPDSSVFLDLIPIFPKSHASQILGFKFQYYQRIEVIHPVPFGLYQLTALLVKKDFIDLDSIYAHLLPKDEEAFEHYNSFSAKRLDKGELGANAILTVSIATCKAGAAEKELPLYKHIADLSGRTNLILPVPAFCLISGGKHAGNNLAIQDIMILPVGARRFEEVVQMGSETYHHLKDLSFVDFSYACLKNVFFSRANLQCAKFRDVDAEGSIFHNATLRECEFTGANLRGALLAGANLQSADLQGGI